MEYALTSPNTTKSSALHAVEWSKYPYDDYVKSSKDCAHLSRALSEGGKAKLREFVKKHSRYGVEPQVVVDQGHVSDLILLFAEIGLRNMCFPVLVVSNPTQMS